MVDYSKFYTPPEVADLLVKQLNISAPSKIVDICCGSCNLLHAAGKRWSKASLFGIDVIKHTSTDVICVQSDGRKFALEHTSQYPLVLANPPFDFGTSKKEYSELYNSLPTGYSTSRLEIEMLLANLRLLAEQGTLMIIMPSTFVAAESHYKIRAYLGQEFYIQKIIHMPDEIFGSAKISSCALVIKRDKSQRRYTKRFYVAIENNKYFISKPTNIPQSLIRDGKWDGTLLPDSKTIKLTFRRGNISSQFFQDKGVPILHTAKIQYPWEPSIRYVATSNEMMVCAESGDIIVSRIGKSAGQWYKYNGPKVLISDCLYVIKDPTGDVARKLNGQQYSYPLKGVATRYITMADFSAWLEAL